jgi:hypothetical protein
VLPTNSQPNASSANSRNLPKKKGVFVFYNRICKNRIDEDSRGRFYSHSFFNVFACWCVKSLKNNRAILGCKMVGE